MFIWELATMPVNLPEEHIAKGSFIIFSSNHDDNWGAGSIPAPSPIKVKWIFSYQIPILSFKQIVTIREILNHGKIR